MRELYSHRSSFIHQMDARVKVIFTLAFILFLSLTPFKAWPAYILYFSLSLSLALLARLGAGFVMKRALLALPFALAALPLIFTGPRPHIVAPLFHGISIHFSPEGCLRFASIAIKAWVSMQAAILLAATTPFSDLLQALKQLKVPKIFVAITGLMWRYLFVIGDEVSRMLCARSSRSAKAPGVRRTGGSVWWRARVTGGMAGSLFLRSLERSDRVYAAMLSRGYSGELPESEAVVLSTADRRTLFLGMGLLTLVWLLGILSGA